MATSPSDISQAPDPSGVLRKVLEMARHLAGPANLDETLEHIIDAGRDVLRADRGTVFLYDASARELYLKVGTGIDDIRFSIDLGIAGECARKRTLINVPDCYQDERFNQDIDKQTGYRTRALMTVPLVGLDDKLVGVMQILNPAKGVFDGDDEIIAQAFASHAAVAIQRARLLEVRLAKFKLDRDLQIARQIQMNVLPSENPVVPGYDIAGFSQPADQTGGDIYDLMPVPSPSTDDPDDRSGLLILLADATGHGVGPAISVTQVRAMLRVGRKFTDDIETLLTYINNQLTADLSSERFVTAFLGLLDSKSHELHYQAPGQAPLLHFHTTEDSCQWLDATSFPLGILRDPPYDDTDPMRLAIGDFVVLLTDGFYEFMDADGRQYGQERVGEVIRINKHEPAETVLSILLNEVFTFAGGHPQQDDLTAILVKRTG